MSTSTETAATTTAAAAKKAAEKVAAVVAETAPTVVETAEVSLEVPAKVVLDQKLVVIVGVVSGVALAVGAQYGWKKFQEFQTKRKVEKAAQKLTESTETK